MCNHPNREAAMVVLNPGTPERHGRDGVWCDPCLAPIVRALNAGGVRTTASCCGHGQVPSTVLLADGRWLAITDEHPLYRHPAPATDDLGLPEMRVEQRGGYFAATNPRSGEWWDAWDETPTDDLRADAAAALALLRARLADEAAQGGGDRG